MINVMLQKINCYFNLYATLGAEHNRKMGHVTLFSDAPDSVVEFGEL